jgi:hypothetical protein
MDAKYSSINKFNSPYFTTAEVNKVNQTVAIKPTTPRFLGHADIIDPLELKSLHPNEYVLLTHRPHEKYAGDIRSNGLRSTKDLALDPQASNDIQDKYQRNSDPNRFGNDPALIYFRPVTEFSGYKVYEGDFVVAVKPDAVFVFDQENRARSNGAGHGASVMPVQEYDNLQKNKPPGSYLNQWKNYIPYSNTQGEEYIPECCVNIDKILPNLFVPHHFIDQTYIESGPSDLCAFTSLGEKDDKTPEDNNNHLISNEFSPSYVNAYDPVMSQTQVQGLHLEMGFRSLLHLGAGTLMSTAFQPRTVIEPAASATTAPLGAMAKNLAAGVIERLQGGRAIKFSKDVSGCLGSDGKTIYITAHGKSVQIALPQKDGGEALVRVGNVFSDYSEPNDEILDALTLAGILRG